MEHLYGQICEQYATIKNRHRELVYKYGDNEKVRELKLILDELFYIKQLLEKYLGCKNES